MRRNRIRRWIKLATGLTALFIVGTLVSGALADSGGSGSSTPTDAATTTPADTTTSSDESGTTTSADTSPPTPTAPLSAPTLLTDKVTYVPGDPVTVTSANWLPGESVKIHLAATGGGTWSPADISATVDAAGGLRITFALPDRLRGQLRNRRDGRGGRHSVDELQRRIRTD